RPAQRLRRPRPQRIARPPFRLPRGGSPRHPRHRDLKGPRPKGLRPGSPPRPPRAAGPGAPPAAVGGEGAEAMGGEAPAWSPSRLRGTRRKTASPRPKPISKRTRAIAPPPVRRTRGGNLPAGRGPHGGELADVRL